MVTLIRTINYILIAIIVIVGGGVALLWQNYQDTGNHPCEREGDRLGIERVEELAPVGSSYPALCGGFRQGRWVQFRAR